jgi:hypothetical protein
MYYILLEKEKESGIRAYWVRTPLALLEILAGLSFKMQASIPSPMRIGATTSANLPIPISRPLSCPQFFCIIDIANNRDIFFIIVLNKVAEEKTCITNYNCSF